MNGEDIIRMAREVADKDKVDPYLNEFVVLTPEELERFASLVAAEEREACAELVRQGTDEPVQTKTLEMLRKERERIAATIRARSKQCG